MRAEGSHVRGVCISMVDALAPKTRYVVRWNDDVRIVDTKALSLSPFQDQIVDAHDADANRLDSTVPTMRRQLRMKLIFPCVRGCKVGLQDQDLQSIQ